MKYPITPLAIVCLLLATLMFTGCAEKQESVNLETERQSFELNAMPAAVTNLEQAKEKLAAKEKLTGQPNVSIEGWADLKFFESKKNEAIFMVREILDDTDHGGEGHDPSSCPFCKRRMEAAPKAAVVFTGKGNRALPYSIQDLFPLKHGDKVVVSGNAKLDTKLDLFKITASGIYLPSAGIKDAKPKN